MLTRLRICLYMALLIPSLAVASEAAALVLPESYSGKAR